MGMMRQKTLWAPPKLEFRFLNNLPPPLRLLPNTQISVSEPEAQLGAITRPPSPQQWRPKLAFSSLIGSITRSLRSVLPLRPVPEPRQPILLPKPLAEAGCSLPLFRPYVAKIPWHGGARAFLSQLFPRYGHYCGPNWSSGKDRGSLLWDRRPIDWLDFCCYCHDMGYDTHDQARLLKADLAFLECLEKPRMATKGGAYSALLYRAMCIAGLRSLIIPYRMTLLRLQSAPSFVEVLSNLIPKVTFLIPKVTFPQKIKTGNHKDPL